MSFSRLLGAAALIAVLAAPAIAVAGEDSTTVVRPYIHSESGCSSWNRTYHYRYRPYRPRINHGPRHDYPRKKKKPLIF